jgi:uncharacterized protein
MWILFALAAFAADSEPEVVPAIPAPAHIAPTDAVGDAEARCSAGDQGACVTLGVAYLEGEGKPRDAFRAAQLFRGACAAESAHACMYMAEAYRKGEGVGTDANEALNHYMKACELGDGLACRSVGDLYVMGSVGRADGTTAGIWYRTGCDLGDGSSCTATGLWMERGDVLVADSKEAVKLFQAGCERGHPRGCTLLAIRYSKGASGLRRDVDAAASWFEKACPMDDSGDPEGCRELGAMQIKGKGTPQNVEQGQMRLERACFQNDHLGCRYLADVEIKAKHWAEATVAAQRGCDLGDEASCRAIEKVQFKLVLSQQ